RRLTVPAAPRGGDVVRAAVRAGDAEALGAALFNRLQSPAFGLAPIVESVYRRLAGLSPAGCLMSGSGAAVFAVCRGPEDAARVANESGAGRPPAEPESRVLLVRTLHIVPARRRSAVVITEVRIKLCEENNERLLAFCSVTFDNAFVVRDLKIIEGTKGVFVAMPSRKLTDRCGGSGGEEDTRGRARHACAAPTHERLARPSRARRPH